MNLRFKISYLSLTLVLLVLGIVYLLFPAFRIPAAVLIGLSYFIWGIFTQGRNRHSAVILEYLVISLLATILLIFMSLRA